MSKIQKHCKGIYFIQGREGMGSVTIGKSESKAAPDYGKWIVSCIATDTYNAVKTLNEAKKIALQQHKAIA